MQAWLADPRELFSGEHVDNPSSAHSRFHGHKSGVILSHLSNDRSLGTERVSPHRGEYSAGGFGRHNRQELPSFGDVKRIQPKNLAGAFHFLTERNVSFVQNDADPSRLRDLAQGASNPATSWIAKHM